MATIKQVAALAAVSTATVSYVLNDNGKVAPATRRRVLEAMAQLNYQPSYAARSLRGQGRTLGLVLPQQGQLADPTLAELLAGITEAAAAKGYHILLANGPEAEAEAELQLARSGRVDGLLLLDLREGDERVARLTAYKVPFVCIGPPPHGSQCASVSVAAAAGAALAVRHLLRLGHRRVALIQLPSELTDSEPRYQGYAAALVEAGIEPDPALTIEGGRSQEDGYGAMQELRSQPIPPTAVLASSDALAFGALHLLHDEGLLVGNDVSVVGFDDVPLAAHSNPPLTTVRLPRQQLGAEAATLLIAQIEVAAPRTITLDTRLIVRRSCGPPRHQHTPTPQTAAP